MTEHGEDDRKKMSIKDALYDYRLSDLTKKDNTYDFSGVTPYELDEYYVNVGDLQFTSSLSIWNTVTEFSMAVSVEQARCLLLDTYLIFGIRCLDTSLPFPIHYL